ncbi:MAG: hypothetical protein ACYS29_06320, partial [Planctomycetota bacterium]
EWFEKSIDGTDTPGALELFNLGKDLNEQHNLTNLMPKKASELYNKLKAWRKEVGAQEMTRNPSYSPVRQ